MATGSECAASQGRFWDYHDLVYGDSYDYNPDNYDYEMVLGFARNLQLNIDEFEDCMLDGSGFERVQESHLDAMRLGVDSTPTLRVNDKWVNSYDSLDAAIAIELADDDSVE